MTVHAKSSELQLMLGSGNVEVVRSFVREAALAETAPLPCANQLAADSAAAWMALSTDAGGNERAHIAVAPARGDMRARILLRGHARFAELVTSLASQLQPGAGIAWHESGIDDWEVILHRSLSGEAPVPFQAEGPEATEGAPASTEDFHIDLAEKRDAPGIARCFLAIYGHNYIHADVFSPQRYWSKVKSGELIPVVARDGSGDVIGHVALERETGAMVAERGEAVVLPAYRGHHLLERMTERLAAEAPKRGLHGIYAEPLTIHTFSQRNDARAGMPVCAVLLGANPENVRPKGIPCPTAGQRQSYLRTFCFVQPPAPRRIQAPAPYEDILLKIYRSLGVDVTVAAASEPEHPDSLTRIAVNSRGYGVVSFERIGRNCAVELAQAVRDVRSLGGVCMQLSARMSDPGLAGLVAAARRLGFFFCGLGPAFAGGEDLFLLQYLSEPLDTAKLQLFTEETKQLVAFIEGDRRSVSGGD